VPSGYGPTRELRELQIKRTLLGDSAPNEREENVFQYVIHRVNEDVRRANEQVRAIITGGLKMRRRNPRRVRRSRTTLKSRHHPVVACLGLVLIAVSFSLSACGEASTGYDYDTASHHEPAKLEPIKGTDVKRVIFSAEGAERVGLQTAPIRQNGEEKIMPYAALIYYADGNTYAYSAPKPLTYVRQEISVDHFDGDSVVLSDGPPAGTEVVTVGVDEVYGTEFEVEE
jgi:hypothetical protein